MKKIFIVACIIVICSAYSMPAHVSAKKIEKIKHNSESSQSSSSKSTKKFKKSFSSFFSKILTNGSGIKTWTRTQSTSNSNSSVSVNSTINNNSSSYNYSENSSTAHNTIHVDDDTNNVSDDKKTSTRGMISINFDDGWQSAHDNALPILESAGFTSTHYIISNALNLPDYIDESDVRELEESGHEIGGHTETHARLGELSASEAREEIETGTSELEDIGISDLATFAYPFGSFTQTVKQLVRDAGYSGARTTLTGFNTEQTDPYELRSTSLHRNTTFEEIKQNIDRAIELDAWYIIVIHQVDGNDFYSVSQELFDDIIEYIDETNVRVVTNEEGLELLRD